MITENECPDDLYNKLETLSKEELINIMYEALDLMNQYNGRTSKYCVTQALRNMGFLK